VTGLDTEAEASIELVAETLTPGVTAGVAVILPAWLEPAVEAAEEASGDMDDEAAAEGDGCGVKVLGAAVEFTNTLPLMADRWSFIRMVIVQLPARITQRPSKIPDDSSSSMTPG
jgi:hypothetical protein